MNIIDTKDLQKHYDHPVLSNINLQIKKGEFVVITGSSGSGKSTLLQILGLLDFISSGEYFLNGYPVHQQNAKQLARLRHEHLGFIFQRYHLLSHLSVLDNILLPLEYSLHAEPISKAKKLLEDFSLSDYGDKRPPMLSYGQQQRVAIIRALITDPDIIFADEPTGSLDSANADIVIDTLHALHQKGKTIILITHDLSLIQKGDTHYRLSKGQLERVA